MTDVHLYLRNKVEFKPTNDEEIGVSGVFGGLVDWVYYKDARSVVE
jgi:hypothetical protein